MTLATQALSREEVLARRDDLPAFPRVISEILATLDDPDANLNLLVAQVSRDPVLAARVFSQANSAALGTRHESTVRNLYTATSLIGLSRLRQTVLMTQLAGFLRGAQTPQISPGFWEHSVAGGICAEQIAAHARLPTDHALIAGLLHDVGQLWLCRFRTEAFLSAWRRSLTGTAIEQAEEEAFGVHHALVGAWLLESWGLPEMLCTAVRQHHDPEPDVSQTLAPVLHVAEVVINALHLGYGDHARVTRLSAACCTALDLHWDESALPLFGRIEAISHFTAAYFTPPG